MIGRVLFMPNPEGLAFSTPQEEIPETKAGRHSTPTPPLPIDVRVGIRCVYYGRLTPVESPSIQSGGRTEMFEVSLRMTKPSPSLNISYAAKTRPSPHL